MSLLAEVGARLKRIKELWRELERTRPASGRYDALVEVIRTESVAYLAILETQPDGELADDPGPTTIAALSPPSGVPVQLERIKKLWLELEGTRQTSARYKALVDLIHSESTAGDFDGFDRRRDFNDPHRPAR